MKLMRDYHHKKFRNTFFGRKWQEHQQKKRWWLFRYKSVYLSLTGVIILGLGYLFFYSPVFRLTELETKGLRDIGFEEMDNLVKDQENQRRFLIFKQNNFFLFSKNQLKDNLNKKYALEILEIKKKPFHKLSIYLQEQTSAITWISGDKFYYLDLSGQVISEVPFKDPNPNFPRIYDESSQPVQYNQEIISSRQIRFIIDVISKLPLRTGDIEISYFKLASRKSSELKLMTMQGWEIYFNTNLDVAEQLDKLALVYEKKIKPQGVENLHYIDLRFGNRVFYK